MTSALSGGVTPLDSHTYSKNLGTYLASITTQTYMYQSSMLIEQYNGESPLVFILGSLSFLQSPNPTCLDEYPILLYGFLALLDPTTLSRLSPKPNREHNLSIPKYLLLLDHSIVDLISPQNLCPSNLPYISIVKGPPLFVSLYPHQLHPRYTPI